VNLDQVLIRVDAPIVSVALFDTILGFLKAALMGLVDGVPLAPRLFDGGRGVGDPRWCEHLQHRRDDRRVEPCCRGVETAADATVTVGWGTSVKPWSAAVDCQAAGEGSNPPVAVSAPKQGLKYGWTPSRGRIHGDSVPREHGLDSIPLFPGHVGFVVVRDDLLPLARRKSAGSEFAGFCRANVAIATVDVEVRSVGV